MRILVADGERTTRDSIRKTLELSGFETAVAPDGSSALAQLHERSFDGIVATLKMPVFGGRELLRRVRGEGFRCPVIITSSLEDLSGAENEERYEGEDFLIKPFELDALAFKLRAMIGIRRRIDAIEAGMHSPPPDLGLAGGSEAVGILREMIARAGSEDGAVLITGEPGTGKEFVARAIHAASPRSSEPFITVNVGAMSDAQAGNELFGFERRAVVGAESRKVGLLELAGSGSLFLDEIAAIAKPLQDELVHALSPGRIRRIGGAREIPVSVRIMAATNRDIGTMAGSGRFSGELYELLSGVSVHVPPLRDRREDIPLLASALLEDLKVRISRPKAVLAGDAIEKLGRYSFPGNMRELENILEDALIHAAGDSIDARGISLGRDRGDAKKVEPGTADPSLQSLERRAIESALRKWKGNRTRAAEELGISRRTIIYKIKQYGFSPMADKRAKRS